MILISQFYMKEDDDGEGHSLTMTISQAKPLQTRTVFDLHFPRVDLL